MTDPMLTVLILAVLWLLVVVPMVVQRKDARAGQRSVARFGAAMRALGSRRVADAESARSAQNSEDGTTSPADDVGAPDPATLFTRARATPSVHVSGPVTRRPVPASKESLMFPLDPQDMSHARRRMLARRRRSLGVLILASIVLLVAAAVSGATWVWAVGLLAVLGLCAYLMFLRSQARRDRIRRAQRRARATTAHPVRDYDATVRSALPDSAVRIDEDDIALDHLDTVDLTGLYSEVETRNMQTRRAG